MMLNYSWLFSYCSWISKLQGSTNTARAFEKSHLNPQIQAGLGGKSEPTQVKGMREADPAKSHPVLSLSFSGVKHTELIHFMCFS